MTKPAARQPRIHIYGDDYVPYYLGHLNNRMSSGASQLYLRHYGIGINEFRILSVLANTPGSNANHICQTLGQHKAVVSRALQEMEKKALVRIDDTRQRSRLLSLTPEGDRLHDEIVRIALQREELLLQGLDARERRLLIDLFQRMLDNMPAVNAWDPFKDPPPRPAAKRRSR